jgi:branched-chain amino acid transport system permease protein
VGVVVGLPALRVKGIYLGMATLAFGFIVEEVLARWERDRRQRGLHVKAPQIFGWSLGWGDVLLPVPVHRRAGHAGHAEPAALAHRARLRGHPRFGDLGAEHGHPPGALQDAVVCAVGRAGRRGGALYAHKLQFISPDQFNILQSIDLLLMIVIGGLGSVHGVFLGALFLISMPQAIAMVKDYLPDAIGQAPGLQAAVYGLVLIAFVLFEPWACTAAGSRCAPGCSCSRSTARACSSGRVFPEIGRLK